MEGGCAGAAYIRPGKKRQSPLSSKLDFNVVQWKNADGIFWEKEYTALQK